MNHAVFIWTAYGATALILLWTALSPLLKARTTQRTIRRLISREQADDTHT